MMRHSPRTSRCFFWGGGGYVADGLQDVSAEGRLFLSKGDRGRTCQVGGLDRVVDVEIFLL